MEDMKKKRKMKWNRGNTAICLSSFYRDHSKRAVMLIPDSASHPSVSFRKIPETSSG